LEIEKDHTCQAEDVDRNIHLSVLDKDLHEEGEVEADDKDGKALLDSRLALGKLAIHHGLHHRHIFNGFRLIDADDAGQKYLFKLLMRKPNAFLKYFAQILVLFSKLEVF
jgi:hypothetical protein